MSSCAWCEDENTPKHPRHDRVNSHIPLGADIFRVYKMTVISKICKNKAFLISKFGAKKSKSLE